MCRSTSTVTCKASSHQASPGVLLLGWHPHEDPACVYLPGPCLAHPPALHVSNAGSGPTYAETTYIFFGRRGSGKTTIRMQACMSTASCMSVTHAVYLHTCFLGTAKSWPRAVPL